MIGLALVLSAVNVDGTDSLTRKERSSSILKTALPQGVMLSGLFADHLSLLLPKRP